MLEEVGRVKELYLKLREMYDHGEALLPDLILTEKEEPLEEIKAILAAGEKMVEPLLYLINSPNFSCSSCSSTIRSMSKSGTTPIPSCS